MYVFILSVFTRRCKDLTSKYPFKHCSTNLLRDEPLFPEKVCTLLFGRGKLKKHETSGGLLRVPILRKQIVPVRRKI